MSCFLSRCSNPLPTDTESLWKLRSAGYKFWCATSAVCLSVSAYLLYSSVGVGMWAFFPSVVEHGGLVMKVRSCSHFLALAGRSKTFSVSRPAVRGGVRTRRAPLRRHHRRHRRWRRVGGNAMTSRRRRSHLPRQVCHCRHRLLRQRSRQAARFLGNRSQWTPPPEEAPKARKPQPLPSSGGPSSAIVGLCTTTPRYHRAGLEN